MRILTGDETGLIKSFYFEKKEIESFFGEQKPNTGILKISILNDKLFTSVSIDNMIKLHNHEDPKYNFVSELKEKSKIVGLESIDNKVFILQEKGQLSQSDLINEDETPYLDESQLLKKFHLEKITTGKINPYDKNSLLILSKDSNPNIIDLNTYDMIWKARNVPNDYLDLQVPIFDTDCAFKSSHQFYVCTAYRKLRLYDTKSSSKKPMIDYQFSKDKYPLNGVLLSKDSNYLYTSDNAGSIFILDTRKDFQLVGKLKGATGSITQMTMSANHPYLFSVSLDRYLRIYNTNTNKFVDKAYMKQKLNSVAILEDTYIEDKVEEGESGQEAKEEEETKQDNNDNDNDNDDDNDEQIIPKKSQNEIKREALKMRKLSKKNKIKLTFEKKPIVSNKGKEEDDDQND